MRLAVELLGRARVLSDGQELTLSRQNIAFIAYLALHRGVDNPREVIIEHFWSSREPSQGRSCLGTALVRLRKALQIDGSDWLETSSRGEPRISPSAPIWFDISTFEAAMMPAFGVSEGKLEGPLLQDLICGLAHYHGDLLPGWYDEWVLPERERLRLLCLRGHRRLVEHYVSVGDVENALAAALSALRIEPLQELVQQQVIELYRSTGQRVAAIRQYEKLSALLRAELGIAPSRHITALINEIRAER